MPPLTVPFRTGLRIRTNASIALEIPVSVFNGRVVPVWNQTSDGGNDTDHFIGLLTQGSSKELYLALWNPNPVGVALQGWGTNGTNGTDVILTYLGSDSGDAFHFQQRANFANLTMATTVRPQHYAVFHVQIHAVDDTVSSLLMYVKTVFETVAITLHYRLIKGNIRTIPDPLPWSAHFLDPFISTEVRLNSTLMEPVTVIGFRAPAPFHQQLNYDLYGAGGGGVAVLQAMQSAGVARMTYPLDWNCAASVLSKLMGEWQLGERWWNALNDLDATSALRRCYETLSSSLSAQIQSLQLVTDEVGHVDVPLELSVDWPSLAAKRRIQFPLTEMGHSNHLDLKLMNPTSSVVLAQILWLEDSQVKTCSTSFSFNCTDVAISEQFQSSLTAISEQF